MQLVVLIIHLILALALIGVVLMQRSEGGALGIGGGGGGGGGMSGFLTGRATANLLTRATAVIAALFIGTSMLLAIMASSGKRAPSDIITAPTPASPSAPATPGPSNTAPKPATPSK
ncbi:MAG: preprotein translocase subunit SecG [Bauldia litoralis]